MAPRRNVEGTEMKSYNKGAWTAEEDSKLAEYIEVHGAKKWKTVATKSGLNRCGKSCRLRWLNYLRPNIKRGNISDEEEDLILRLHRLLGNRWSLIAGRLPGRTDNEIKNYWNSHLSKKINQMGKTAAAANSESQDQRAAAAAQKSNTSNNVEVEKGGGSSTSTSSGEHAHHRPEAAFDANDFFDFSTQGTYGLDWVNKFLELDDDDDEDLCLADDKK